MNKFKAGDTVKRFRETHEGMKTGETAIVKKWQDWCSFFLEGYDLAHDPANFELVKSVDEKESTAKFLREEKWWIKCNSQLEFELINDWLEENSNIRCHCNPPESCKIITNFNSNGKKDYIRWNDRDNYPKENEVKIEFETIVKSVKLPEVVPKKTEQQLRIEELEATIAQASAQIKHLKEMK